MNPLLYPFVSGNTFFIGAIVLAVCVALSYLSQELLVRVALRFIASIGVIGIAFSTTVVPGLLYSLWMIVSALWFVTMSLESAARSKAAHILRGLLILFSLLAIAFQMPHSRHPSLPKESFDRFYLIADSISSGINQGETTWHELIRREHSVQVVNLSRPGETLRSCLPQAKQIPPGRALVVLEIGGNDLLNRSPLSEFEKDLEELFRLVCTPERVVVLFELPAPPFMTGYCRVQRTLAKRHGVKLIPRRVFARVLSGEGNTIDNLHLSNKGHRMMADEVWSILSRVLTPSTQRH